MPAPVPKRLSPSPELSLSSDSSESTLRPPPRRGSSPFALASRLSCRADMSVPSCRCSGAEGNVLDFPHSFPAKLGVAVIETACFMRESRGRHRRPGNSGSKATTSTPTILLCCTVCLIVLHCNRSMKYRGALE